MVTQKMAAASHTSASCFGSGFIFLGSGNRVKNSVLLRDSTVHSDPIVILSRGIQHKNSVLHSHR